MFITVVINRKEFFMKKIKKALIGITSLVMAFSMTAICACSSGNKGGDDDGGITGGEQGGTETKSDAIKVLEAFQKQSFKGINLEYTLDGGSTSTEYHCDEEGAILEGATKQVEGWRDSSFTSEKINIKDLEIDAINTGSSERLDAEGKVVEGKGIKWYNYAFIRGGQIFSTERYKATTDFSDVAFEYGGAMEMPEYASAALEQIPAGGVTGDILSPVSAILNLADIYGGATFADKKLTVDLNKIAYKLYGEVLAEIEKINENTTVGELIAVKPVKNLIESLTYGLDAKQFVDELKKNFTEGENKTETLAEEGAEESAAAMAMVAGLVKVLPDAAEGESVYNYLVKVLNTKEFGAAVIGLLTGSPLDVPVALGDFKVMQIVSMVSKIMTPPESDKEISGGVSSQAEGAQPEMTIDDVKELIKSYLNVVAVTEDKVTIDTSNEEEKSSMDLSALKLVFAVGDDYTVSSVSFSGNYSSTSSHVSCSQHYDQELGVYVKTYTKYESSEAYDIEATVELSKDEYTLTNVSNNNVLVTANEVEENGTYYCVFNIDDEKLKAEYILRVTLGAEDANGYYPVTKFEALDKVGGNVIATSTEGSSLVLSEITIKEWPEKVNASSRDEYLFDMYFSFADAEDDSDLYTFGSKPLQEAKKVSEIIANK